MSYISLSLNFLINAVKKAGNTLSRDFSEIEQLQSSVRGHAEFAKAAQERVAKILKIELQKGKPDYAFVSGNQPLPSRNCFTIAPLDGMLNFMHGIPMFAVSAAIIENKQVTAAVVYNPATADLFFAEKGCGAFREGHRNHERLRVSGRKELKDALVGTVDNNIAEQIMNSRNIGALSLELAMLAAGKLDAIISKGNNIEAYAAGLLLVKEAGGYVYEYEQKDIRTDNQEAILQSGNLIAGNAEIAPKLFVALHK